MRVKNIVSVGSLLLLSVALACSITYVVKSNNKQSKLIESDLEFNANFVSIWLKTAFYHSNDVLHQLSDTLEQDGFATLPLSGKSYQEQSDVFEFQYETLINAIHVFVVNKNCILLNTKTIGGVDLSSREYCQILKQDDKSVESIITSPFKDLLNRNVIVQGVKITDEKNNFAGIVGLLTDFTFFNQVLKNVKLSENSTISILSSDFTVLASTAPQHLPIGEKLDFSYIPENKIKGLKYNQKVMFDSAKTYNGEHQGILVKKVSDLPFMILVTKAKYYWFTPLYITIFIVSMLMILLSFFIFKNAYYFQTLIYQAEHYSKLALYDELTGYVIAAVLKKSCHLF
ncbi:PDC sensor domain-containing protein [Aliivibrio salmonicida]|uniref:PDC sensor domain-containing protein n=1 Tax=Aliivibrio salmonicida TaxID=40269 RepID=UPI001F5C4D9C|nr:cache domain-containing protein [Aliivibrio salmonicida]